MTWSARDSMLQDVACQGRGSISDRQGRCDLTRQRSNAASSDGKSDWSQGRCQRSSSCTTVRRQRPPRSPRSLSVFLGRHVAKTSSKTREVNTDATAGEGRSAPITGNTRWVSPTARSTQIKGEVSVHQESLIR
jgi:hypothetical protein